MTITQNLCIGFASWATLTNYGSVAGVRVINGSNAYELISAGGISGATGPTGTGSSISDGTCTWKFLVTPDFTSFSSWTGQSGWPALTSDYIALLWKPNNTGSSTDGKISLSAGTFGPAAVTIAANTSSFKVTLSVAAGESLFDGNNALWPNAQFGVLLYLTNSPGNAYSAMFNLEPTTGSSTSPHGFYFSRLQFDAAGLASFASNNDNSHIAYCNTNDCIFRGASNGIGNGLITMAGNGSFGDYSNTTFMDLATGTFATIISHNNPSSAICCTFYAPNSPTAASAMEMSYGYTSSVVQDCMFFGYTTPLAVRAGGSNNYLSSHNITDKSSLGSRVTDTGSLFSKTAANQFVSVTSDLRLKAGADAIDAGIDTHVAYPNTALDSFGTARPQGSAYDQGAYEYLAAGPTFIAARRKPILQAVNRASTY